MSYLTKREIDFIYKMAEGETQPSATVNVILSEFLFENARDFVVKEDISVRYEMAVELFEKLIEGNRRKMPSYGELRLVNKPQYQQDLDEIQRQRWLCELQESSVAKFQEDKRKRESEEQEKIESDIIQEAFSTPTEEARQKQIEAYELLRKMQDE